MCSLLFPYSCCFFKTKNNFHYCTQTCPISFHVFITLCYFNLAFIAFSMFYVLFIFFLFFQYRKPFSINCNQISSSTRLLGGVCFFYLMLNRNFFELNVE